MPLAASPPPVQAVIAVGLLRFWAVLSAADVAFLLAIAGASAALLAWRRLSPASARSFARHREVPAVLLRVAIAASPAAWKVTRQALAGVPPYTNSGGGMWNAAVFGLSLGFCSFGATANVLVSLVWVELWAGRWLGCCNFSGKKRLPWPCGLAMQG